MVRRIAQGHTARQRMMGAQVPSSPPHCILRVGSLSPILLLPPSFLLLCCPFSRSPACLPSCRSLPVAGEYFPSQALDLHYCIRSSQPPRGRNYHGYLHYPDKLREVKELVQGHTASKSGSQDWNRGRGRGLFLEPELLTLTTDSALAKSHQGGAWRDQEAAVGRGLLQVPWPRETGFVDPHPRHLLFPPLLQAGCGPWREGEDDVSPVFPSCPSG